MNLDYMNEEMNQDQQNLFNECLILLDSLTAPNFRLALASRISDSLTIDQLKELRTRVESIETRKKELKALSESTNPRLRAIHRIFKELQLNGLDDKEVELVYASLHAALPLSTRRALTSELAKSASC